LLHCVGIGYNCCNKIFFATEQNINMGYLFQTRNCWRRDPRLCGKSRPSFSILAEQLRFFIQTSWSTKILSLSIIIPHSHRLEVLLTNFLYFSLQSKPIIFTAPQQCTEGWECDLGFWGWKVFFCQKWFWGFLGTPLEGIPP